jgi:hypothetical protein
MSPEECGNLASFSTSAAAAADVAVIVVVVVVVVVVSVPVAKFIVGRCRRRRAQY